MYVYVDMCIYVDTYSHINIFILSFCLQLMAPAFGCPVFPTAPGTEHHGSLFGGPAPPRQTPDRNTK